VASPKLAHFILNTSNYERRSNSRSVPARDRVDLGRRHRTPSSLGYLPGASHSPHRDEIAVIDDDRGNHGIVAASLFQQPSEFQT